MSFTVDYTLNWSDIRNGGKEDVVVNTTGTNLAADAVRVTIDKETAFATNPNIFNSREELLLALDIIREKIMQGDWKPATDA
mgnify:CR=1 FL=1